MMAASPYAASGYDIHTKALTPISERAKPSGEAMPFVSGGRLDFAIVADLAAEARAMKSNSTQASVAPAVEVLVEAFRRTAGQAPVVVQDGASPAAAGARYKLVVGDCATARAAGFDRAAVPDQGFEVFTFPGGIVVAGCDSSLVEGYNRGVLERRGSSRGTFYGALDFAERFLGVRWYFPGEFGTHWPRVDELVVKPVRYSDEPYFNTRGGPYNFTMSLSTKPLQAKWSKYMGPVTASDAHFVKYWRDGGTLPSSGGHSPRPERMAKAHPDKMKTIFYTSPHGKFWYNDKGHVGNYYNVLDLGFADILVDDWKAFYSSGGKDDAGGFRESFSDAWASFGVCDTYLPLSEMVGNGVVRELGLISEKDIARGGDAAFANVYARFYQYLARRMEREMPGRRLMLLVYYNSKYASLDPRWKLPSNVDAFICDGNLPTRIGNKAAMEKSRRLFREWYDALGGRPALKVWTYASRFNPFVRAIAPEFIGDIPKVLGKYLGRGFIYYGHDGAGDIWHYYYALYAGYKSQWNPDFDVDAALDEHFDVFFGAAGPHMKRFHAVLKKAYRDYFTPSDDPVPLYPAAVVDEMESCLAKARAAVAPGTPERRRCDLIADYWPHAFEQQRARAAYEPPVYDVRRLGPGESPVVDGVPDEPFWKGVRPVPLMDTKRGTPPAHPADVRLAWREDGLYAAFSAPEPATADESSGLWFNDNYEMFLSPGLGKQVKYHLGFDALGRFYAGKQRLLPISQPPDLSWKADGRRLAVRRSKAGWTAELFVPFSALEGGAPRAYDSWNFNLVRNFKGREQKVDSRPAETSGSSLTLGDNHAISLFGIMRFAGLGD